MFTHLTTSADTLLADRPRRGGGRNHDSGKQRAPGRAMSDSVDLTDLSLVFQPRVGLDTGLRIGAEAGVRWICGKHGRVAPSVFLPLAEASGKITDIGGWMLGAACEAASRWEGLNVSVKVSVRQLEDEALLGQVAAALDASGLMPELLELEFEQALMTDVSMETMLALSAIRDLGVGVAVGDYGGGFATLGMLKRLPLTALKLDRAVVRDAGCNADDAAIARAIVQTGRALGLIVIADGIESEAQRDFLLEAGCQEGQGALFGPPVVSAAFRTAAPGAPRDSPPRDGPADAGPCEDGLAMAADGRR